jgi:integrase
MSGHIEKRGDRSWRVKFDAGTDPATGKRITRRVTVKGTKKDAERRLTELLGQRDTGSLVAPSKVLLRDYLEQWLAGWCIVNLSPGTAERYGFAVKTQVLPHLGHIRLQDLKPAHLSPWYANLLTNGRSGGGVLAPRTVRNAHRILHKALEVAVEDGLILKNPVSIKRPPKTERVQVQILKPEEVPILVSAFKGRPLRCFIVLALASGARRGELLALRWSDVDLDEGVIKIARSLEETRAAGLRFKEPKTAAGRRTIGIPAAVVDELRAQRKARLEWRLKLGQRRPADDLVFCTWHGSARSPGAVSREFAKRTEQAGLGHITLHALRHTHASALIAAGVSIVDIARRLGHSSPAITLGVYAHLFGSQDSAAVKAIDATLAGALGE